MTTDNPDTRTPAKDAAATEAQKQSPSMLGDSDIDRLVEAQKKPEDVHSSLKEKVTLMKRNRETARRLRETQAKGVTEADFKDINRDVNKDIKDSVKNSSNNNNFSDKNFSDNKNTSNKNTNGAKKFTSPLLDQTMGSIMSGNTSAGIECIINGTSTSTPQQKVEPNTSNSFDSLGTQKASSFNAPKPSSHTAKTSFNPNITNILADVDLDNLSVFSEDEEAQKPVPARRVPPPLTGVLTDAEPTPYPLSPDYYSEDHADVRVGASFHSKSKPYNFGNSYVNAHENARRTVSESQKSAAPSAQESQQQVRPSYQRPASSYMEKIRTEVDKEHSREKKLARERLRSHQKNFELLQTPQTRKKFNMQVPLDMSEEQLFEVICKLTTQLEKSKEQVSEMEEELKRVSEELKGQTEEADTLRSLQEETEGEKEMLETQLEQQMRHVRETTDAELKHVTETKDSEIRLLKEKVHELTETLNQSSVADIRTLKTDYEYYKNQCYRKDLLISDLEARLKQESNLEDFETSLKEKEKRLIKTELRLGQQALEQDHERQKLEAEKRVFEEKDEEERLRNRLRELNGRGERESRDSRGSRDSRDSRSSRDSRDFRDSRGDRYYDRSRSRSDSSRTRYRRRSGSVERDGFPRDKDYSVSRDPPSDLRSTALEKVIDFLLARQKSGVHRAHMDACYNVGGPGERYSDGLSDDTVEKVLKEFLNKDESYLKDLLAGDGKRLEEYLGAIYEGI